MSAYHEVPPLEPDLKDMFRAQMTVAASRTPCAWVYADLAAWALPPVRIKTRATTKPSSNSPVNQVAPVGTLIPRLVPARGLMSGAF